MTPLFSRSPDGIPFRTVLLTWLGAGTLAVALLTGGLVYQLEYESELAVSKSWMEATTIQLAQSADIATPGEGFDTDRAQRSVLGAYEAIDRELAERPGWPDAEEIISAISLIDRKNRRVLASAPAGAVAPEKLLAAPLESGTGLAFGKGVDDGFRAIVPVTRSTGDQDVVAVIDARRTYLRTVILESASAAGLTFAVGIAICSALAALLARSLSRATQLMVHGVSELASGRYASRVESGSRVRELRHLETGLNELAGKLEDAAILGRQVDVAEAIQKHLLPEQSGTLDHVSYCGIVRFSDRVGGDIFEIIQHEGKVYVLIADVVGHGIGASLLASLCHGTFTVAVREGQCDLRDAMSWLNRLLCRHQYAGSFVTAFAAVYTPATRTVEWISAGHEPVYHLRSDGGLETLGSRCIPLGVDEGTVFSSCSTDVSARDTLLASTDGVRERRDQQGALFGEEALERVVRRHADSNPAELVDAVIEAEELFAGGGAAADDRTVVAVRILD